MKFRTEITLIPQKKKIYHQDGILAIGSCFAENIAQQMGDRFFNVLVNPFGTLYNPLSIAESLTLIVEKRLFTENDLFFYQGEWHSFWHHHTFSGIDREQTLRRINEQIQQAHRFLKQARWLILTLGTAFVYFHLPENRLVANCHKLPEKAFVRRRLDVQPIVQALTRVFSAIREWNPEINILLTVSPIRHLRDGFVQNQVSKATLILSVQNLIQSDPSLLYFPSYEIMMDDLRDYRFYENNLTHPNDMALRYIWEKFSGSFFDKKTIRAAQKFYKITLALRHRALNPEAPNYHQFLLKTLKDIQRLEKDYPYVNLLRAKNQIEDQIKKFKFKID